MMNLSHIEDDDGVQLCPMSASVTEQADLRFADPATHVIHICVIVVVVVVTVMYSWSFRRCCFSASCAVRFSSKHSTPVLQMNLHGTQSSQSVSQVVVSMLHSSCLFSFGLCTISVAPQ